MPFFKKIISFLSLYLREKLIEKKLNYENLKYKYKIQNRESSNNILNIFINLNFFRSTYDVIGQLIYSKIYADQNNLECNLIIIKDKNEKAELNINHKKELNFINDATNLRHNNITLSIIHCVENFNPNIFIFNNSYEAENFYNSNTDLKIPPYAEANKILKWDNYYIKINNLYKKNGGIAYLKAPKYAKEYIDYYLDFKKINQTKGIVTLTLRNSSYTKIRNSNLGSWKRFYNWLLNRNYFPIFVNDIEDQRFENHNLKNFNCFELASTNLHLRLALYEKAIMNCGTGCGPTLSLNFSKNPYLLFKTFVNYDCSASLEQFEKINGFKLKQWPFAQKNQKIVWDPNDNYELLVDEFLKIEKIINN